MDPATARTLDLHPDGALLARPDAQVVAHWPTAPADAGVELAAALPAWVTRQPVTS